MKTVIAIGGGELRERETLKIDEYIANLAKERAGDKRAYALFIPTASHDFMPYYNTFHKVYTGVFNIKTDVALTVFKDIDYEKIKGKFEKADMIYVGGGDTLFMLEKWRESGLLPLIEDAYNRGVVISGLSAGAICWFKQMFTDSAKIADGQKYTLQDGLGWFEGTCAPHYNSRGADFDGEDVALGYGIEDNSAIVIRDGEVIGSLSSGGTAYKIEQKKGEKIKTRIKLV